MPGTLAGKVSIITGTGGSVGRAAAAAFAREGAAARCSHCTHVISFRQLDVRSLYAQGDHRCDGQDVRSSRGEAVDAILASAAIPVVFPPVYIDRARESTTDWLHARHTHTGQAGLLELHHHAST